MHPIQDFFKAITTRGTAACAVFYGALGLMLGRMLILFGFWRTLLVVLLCAAGVVIGKFPKVSEGTKDFINKQFPPRKATTVTLPTREAVSPQETEKNEPAEPAGAAE